MERGDAVMKIATCPRCNRRSLRKADGPVTFRLGSRAITVPNVPRLRCSACGEQVFGPEANRVLDAYRRRSRSRRVA
jgi:YgiT-type zinc finger domain-containing protein